MFLYKKSYLPLNCELRNSLCYIFGVGYFKSFLICCKLGLSFPYFISNFNGYYFYLLSSILNAFTWLQVRIKNKLKNNIIKLIDIGCYRGIRHEDYLPCRGQRTRTNARCRKKLKRLY